MVSLLVQPNVAAQQWLPSTNASLSQTQSAFEERETERVFEGIMIDHEQYRTR